jgi:hypothetical protein
MKAFAYPLGETVNEYGLIALRELSISADADTVRLIANFMMDAANEMDRLGKNFDHVHMQDGCSSWQETWPDIVICKQVQHTGE